MASHAIYDKAPLELGGQSIRLVEILSSSKGPEISLRFHTTRLSRVPESIGSTKYYALSYTWGHTANQKRILVDGMEFYIRENLWHFLQQQTYLKSNDFIWIDALCIDQGNVHERNHQVMIMALIFSQASYVLVWLGPAADDSDEAMDFLGNIPLRKPYNLTRPNTSTWQRNLHKNRPLLALFQRNYWNRMWIVQELRLSRGWILLCGQKQVDWTLIKEFCIGSHRLWESNRKAKAILNLACWKTQGDRFTTLFRSCKEQECEDPRDKIYALLGLVLTGGHDIPVDYSLSSTELYARVLKSTLKCDARFALNDMLARDFERDLRLSLRVPSNDASVNIERQNFLDWCWAFQDFDFKHDSAKPGWTLANIHQLSLSVFNAERFQPSKLVHGTHCLTQMTGKERRLLVLEKQRRGGIGQGPVPRFTKCANTADLEPVTNTQPPFRRAHPDGGYISPLQALTTHLPATYSICNRASKTSWDPLLTFWYNR